ncbi:MAG: hypothetical protein HQ483_14615 [Rhodospirillales bacterium]|nr:hypothetical protein [Rhodospirillales bacterium]
MSEESGDIVKVDKASWPRTPVGTIDWEIVFEDPKVGLIPAISVAQKTETLIDCAAVITEILFSRASDEDIRAGYTSSLASLAINNIGESAEVVLALVITFLRDIKDDRIQRAADWVRHKAQRDASGAMADLPTDGTSGAPKKIDPNDPETMFQEVFCDNLDQRFLVLCNGVTQRPMDGRKIPFLVSKEFSLRLQAVVRKEFMPIILPKCRHLIASAEKIPLKIREKNLRHIMADDLTRKELWDVWKYTWRHVMQEVELPKKPKTESAGMLKSLVKAVQAIGENEQTYSMEAWQEDVATARMQQATVREIWQQLTAPSPVFEPPLEEDKLLLMNMFAKTPGGLRDQISALRQIAQQSEQVGRAFDIYAKGKDLQLALIGVSYQHPDLFLTGNVLKNMLRGVSQKAKELDFPLILRYLKGFL